jgi:hypothetical protein
MTKVVGLLLCVLLTTGCGHLTLQGKTAAAITTTTFTGLSTAFATQYDREHPEFAWLSMAAGTISMIAMMVSSDSLFWNEDDPKASWWENSGWKYPTYIFGVGAVIPLLYSTIKYGRDECESKGGCDNGGGGTYCSSWCTSYSCYAYCN